MSVTAWHTQARPRLELKTRPRFRPVSSGLSVPTLDLYAPLDSQECGQVTFVPSTFYPLTVFLQPIEIRQSQESFEFSSNAIWSEIFSLKTVVCVFKL